LAEEIAKYDANDCAQVCQRVRQEADLEATVDSIAGLYEEVVAEHKQRPPPDPLEELRAAGAYLHSVSPLLKNLLNGIHPIMPVQTLPRRKSFADRIRKVVRGR